MDFGQYHKNTSYAENLDFEQELDRELENVISWEKREHQRFVNSCRKAKCNITTIKKCEKEIERQTSSIRKDIATLESQIKSLEIQVRCRGTIKKQKELEKAKKELIYQKQLLDRTVTSISKEIFGAGGNVRG